MNLRLDDVYKMTAAIYEHANMTRSREATYLHFVEVCSMLTMMHRQKNRERVDMPGALCKVMGWYFPLLAKMGIQSVEEMVFSKFPRVCPYCRLGRHEESECKLVKGTANTVDHENLRWLSTKNRHLMPIGINDWQEMFKQIYPRPLNATSFSLIALFEELGELAEAIRVFDRYPHYFYGEAADVFSYIMGIANEYKLKPEGRNFDFEAEYLSRYPGLCINCGYHKCACPPVPAATIGRMTKELKLDSITLTIRDATEFSKQGTETGHAVLESVSNNPEIGKHLPYDRGDLNDAMMQLCYRLANSLGTENPELAHKLRVEASYLGSIRQERGTLERTGEPDKLLSLLISAWGLSGESERKEIQDVGGAVSDLANIFEISVNSGIRPIENDNS